MRIPGAALAAALGLLCALASASPAAAHAQLVRAEPVDGAVLPAAPSRLVLMFNERVSPLLLRIVRPSGETDILQADDGGSTITMAAPSLGQGTHVLSWRVVSADGHPIAGSILFSIGTITNPGQLPAETASRATSAALWLAKLVAYCGLFFGIGGVFFHAWIAAGGRRDARMLPALLSAGLAATAAAVGLQGLDALGLPPGAIARPAVWRTGMSTSFGVTALAAAAALALAMAAMRMRGTAAARMLSTLALCGAGAALAASGHASTASPQWLMRPAVFAHVVGVTAWAGALLPLAALLKTGGGDAASALRRFSAAIPFVVGIVLASGLVLAAIQIETPDALTTTDYGRVLLAKLAIVAAILLLAAINRWRLTRGALAGERRAAGTLARLALVETVLFAIALGAVALWRFTPPPRAIAQSVAMVHLHTQRLMAELTIRPDSAGPVRASILVMTGDYQPIVPKEVTVALSLPEAGIEEIRRPAELGADGLWHVRGLVIPVSGIWTAQIDVLVSDFESLQIKDRIVIGSAHAR